MERVSSFRYFSINIRNTHTLNSSSKAGSSSIILDGWKGSRSPPSLRKGTTLESLRAFWDQSVVWELHCTESPAKGGAYTEHTIRATLPDLQDIYAKRFRSQALRTRSRSLRSKKLLCSLKRDSQMEKVSSWLKGCSTQTPWLPPGAPTVCCPLLLHPVQLTGLWWWDDKFCCSLKQDK